MECCTDCFYELPITAKLQYSNPGSIIVET